MTAPVRLGLLGCGTVGGGVVSLLRQNERYLAERVGAPLEVAAVLVRDADRARVPELDRALLTTDPQRVLEDPTIDVIVETVGGVVPARAWLEHAIDRKRSVVTANKALLAAHGPALLDRAVAAGVDVAFEASVGGGIPIVRTLREAFASDWVMSLIGIVNGTCNFVLTRMREGGLSFDQALAEAQEKGYAEADPELDVGGHDAAHKLVVLAMVAFGARVDASSVPTEGIRDLEAADHAFADRFGYAIKHLAIGRDAGRELELRVHPALVRKDSALANVNGVLNAIALEGRALGPCLLSGRGAGAMPTAVSVVADVLDVARAVRSGVQGLMTRGIQMQERPVRALEALQSRYYLRFSVADEARVLGAIATHLGRAGVTVEQMVQTDGSLVMTTHPARETDLDRALEHLKAEHLVLRPPRRLRIVEL